MLQELKNPEGKAFMEREASTAIWFVARGSQSIKIDIGESFDKSISIDKLNLNDIDFIGQSIKFDTHTPTKC